MTTAASAGEQAELDEDYGLKVDPRTLLKKLEPGVADLRDAPIFREHPLTDIYVSEHGLTLPVQFHAYNTDNATIVCLADLKEVTTYLQGTPYRPIKTQDGKAIVNVLLNHYLDTSAGPYDAFLVNIFASRVDVTLDSEDAISTLLPLFDETTVLVFGPLALSNNTAALDIGRDVLGLNKFIADAKISVSDTQTTGSIEYSQGGDSASVQVLRVKVGGAPTLRGLLNRLGLLWKLGLKRALRLMVDPQRPIAHPFIGYDPASGIPLAVSKSWTQTDPTFKLWDEEVDSLEPAPGSPYSDLLIRFKLEPVLSTRDRLVCIAVEPEETRH